MTGARQYWHDSRSRGSGRVTSHQITASLAFVFQNAQGFANPDLRGCHQHSPPAISDYARHDTPPARLLRPHTVIAAPNAESRPRRRPIHRAICSTICFSPSDVASACPIIIDMRRSNLSLVRPCEEKSRSLKVDVLISGSATGIELIAFSKWSSILHIACFFSG